MVKSVSLLNSFIAFAIQSSCYLYLSIDKRGPGISISFTGLTGIFVISVGIIVACFESFLYEYFVNNLNLLYEYIVAAPTIKPPINPMDEFKILLKGESFINFIL